MVELETFVERAGGRAEAAVLIGVAETTLWRWLRGRSRPRGLALRRLEDLGIAWSRGAAAGRIARVARVRTAAEAHASNEDEMLAGMLALSPAARVADVDLLRIRLGRQKRRGGAASMTRTVRVVRRADA